MRSIKSAYIMFSVEMEDLNTVHHNTSIYIDLVVNLMQFTHTWKVNLKNITI